MLLLNISKALSIVLVSNFGSKDRELKIFINKNNIHLSLKMGSNKMRIKTNRLPQQIMI